MKIRGIFLDNRCLEFLNKENLSLLQPFHLYYTKILYTFKASNLIMEIIHVSTPHSGLRRKKSGWYSLLLWKPRYMIFVSRKKFSICSEEVENCLIYRHTMFIIWDLSTTLCIHQINLVKCLGLVLEYVLKGIV